jgi:hypothetical protein
MMDLLPFVSVLCSLVYSIDQKKTEHPVEQFWNVLIPCREASSVSGPKTECAKIEYGRGPIFCCFHLRGS